MLEMATPQTCAIGAWTRVEAGREEGRGGDSAGLRPERPRREGGGGGGRREVPRVPRRCWPAVVASSAMESATWRSVVTVSSGRDAGDQDGGDESAGKMSTARAAGGGERSRRGVSTRRRAFGCRRSSFVVDLPGTAETIVCAHQSARLPQSLVGCVGVSRGECEPGRRPGAVGRDQGRVASRRWLSPAVAYGRALRVRCPAEQHGGRRRRHLL